MAALWITGKQAVMQAETAWAHTRARTRVRTAGPSRELRFACTLEASCWESEGEGYFRPA